jgi:hypothetical protein
MIPHLLLGDGTDYLLGDGGFLLLGGQYYYNPGGFMTDENGAVFVTKVAPDFAGAPGDIFIRGTRYSAEGRMYVTEG